MATDISSIAARATAPLESTEINGCTPFFAQDANAHRAQAYALLTILSNAFEDADNVGEDSLVTSLRGTILAQGIEGIAALIGVAHHFDQRAEYRKLSGLENRH